MRFTVKPMAEISVEIVFALADIQDLRSLSVPAGATVGEVVARSGLVDRFPQHNLTGLKVGIWGRVVQPDQVVNDGERVEIYRPLEMDPREARRKLADAGRTMGAKTAD